MQTANELLLCDYEHPHGRAQLWAVLDELTLTYSVIDRAPDGSSVALRRHVASIRAARAWAGDYRDRQSQSAAAPPAGRPRPEARPESRCRAAS